MISYNSSPRNKIRWCHWVQLIGLDEPGWCFVWLSQVGSWGCEDPLTPRSLSGIKSCKHEDPTQSISSLGEQGIYHLPSDLQWGWNEYLCKRSCCFVSVGVCSCLWPRYFTLKVVSKNTQTLLRTHGLHFSPGRLACYVVMNAGPCFRWNSPKREWSIREEQNHRRSLRSCLGADMCAFFIIS